MEEAINIYEFILNFEYFCSKEKQDNFNKEIFSVKFKILFFIYKYKKLSPSEIVEFLSMAKSNVALFCKQLLQEQLIISCSDQLDHRIIYYCLTKKGERFVEKQFNILCNSLKQKFSNTEVKDMHNSIKKVNKIFLKSGD